MSVLISGALIDGAGIPMSGCHIILKSRVNTSEVVMRTVADVMTGNNGEYSFEAQVGKYCVYLKQDWRDEYCVGDISVYDDSKTGTLNDFLTALDEGDLKPDVVARFEAMVAQAQQSANDAAGSAQKAEKHATDAEQCAAESRKNAEATAADRTATAEDVKQSEQNAAESAQSAQDAKGYRDSAQQIVDGLNATNATTTQKGLVQLSSATDSDSEELAATPKAVKAVMDETKTKAPLLSPAFSGTPRTPTPPDDASGTEIANAAFVRLLIAALVDSVHTSPPGRYLVVQYGGSNSNDIIDGIVFSGEVEIKMLDIVHDGNHAKGDKFVTFTGVNNDVYCCQVRANSTDIRWTCLSQNLTALDGARWMFSTAGAWYDVPFRDVAVGGLTPAAYRAANMDEYTIKRGDNVSGSTLTPCAVMVSNDGTPRYVLDTRRHFSGSYVSLGNSTQATSDFIFGLFVRTA